MPDGTVGIYLPDAGSDLEYVVVARLAFEGQEVTWEDGPSPATAGEYVSWFVDVPSDTLADERQYDYLSDLSIVIELYSSGVRIARIHAGWARVAFDRQEGPLVMMPDEAEELAPGDAWSPGVTARTEGVDPAEVPRPPPPEDADEGPHAEEDAP